MKAKRLNVLAAVSALLCAATVVVMFSGIGVGDTWVVQPGESAGACALALVFGVTAFGSFAAARRDNDRGPGAGPRSTLRS